MQEIKIIVKNRIARPAEGIVVCCNTDYKVIFEFDEEWPEADLKTLRVISGKGYEEVTFTGNEVIMPQVQNVTQCKIGVYCGDLQSTTPAYFECKKSILSGAETHQAPTEDVYNQIVEMIEEGRLKGPKGDQGPEGPQGPKGDKGDPGDYPSWGNIHGDLSNQTDLYAELNKKANKTYVDQADSALNEGKQNKNDPQLATTNKSIVGAINELYDSKQDKEDETLETESTNIVGAINEIRANLEQEGQTRARADELLQEDIDTKVTSIPAQTGNPFVYGRMNSEAGGTEGKFTMSADVLTGCVVKRQGDSSILVRATPTRDNEAIGKAYADLAAQQVKQTQSTNNGYFPIIHKIDGTATERTGQVFFNSKVAMNPSTGNLKATSFTEDGTSLEDKYCQINDIATTDEVEQYLFPTTATTVIEEDEADEQYNE